MSSSSSWEILVLTGVSCIGGFLFGYDTGVVSGCVIFLQKSLDLSSSMVEVVVSSTVGMAAVGAAVSAKPLQTMGRKPVIALASLFYALGSSVIAFAPGIVTVIAGRLLLGLGVGLSSMAIPPYISESAPIRIRGRLVSMYNFSIVLGQAVACAINIVCEEFLAGEMRWRIGMGIAAIPALIQFVAFLGLPESPKFLMMRGKKKEAEQVLRRLRGIHDENAPNTTEIHDFLRDTEASTTESDSLNGALQKVKNSAVLQRIFRLGLGLMLLQQLSGINTVMYYGAAILIDAGIPESKSVALTAALAAAQGFGIICASPLFDRFGRRNLLIPSTLSAGLSLSFIAIAFVTHTIWLSLLGVFIYLFAFGFGLSSGPWIVNAEVYPTELRGLGISSSTTMNWLANYLVSATFLTACKKLGEAATFFMLAGIAYIGAIWIFIALPETAGQALSDHQILTLFDSKSLLARSTTKKKSRSRRRRTRDNLRRRPAAGYAGLAQQDEDDRDIEDDLDFDEIADDDDNEHATKNPMQPEDRRDNFMQPNAAPLPAPVRPILSSSTRIKPPAPSRLFKRKNNVVVTDLPPHHVSHTAESSTAGLDYDDHPDGV